MAELIKWALMWLLGMFVQSIPEIIKRIFMFIGLGSITYTGITFGEDLLRDEMSKYLGGLPAYILDFIGIMKIDMAFTMILSAWTIKAVMNGMNGTSKSEIGFKDKWRSQMPKGTNGTYPF
jgi:hypothetical protein